MAAGRGRLGSGLVLGVASLVVPALWVVSTRRWENLGDIALIELRTRDVLSLDPPLTGAYSRYGWSHPGPAAFEVFAIPARLLGSGARGLAWTVLAWNATLLGLIGWLLARRGPVALATGSVVVAAMVWTLDPLALADPWNVTAVLLPLVVLLVAVWSVGCGDPHGLGIAVLAFVVVAQSHGGFGLALTPVMALLGWWYWQARPDRTADARRRPSWMIVVAVALWIPVGFDTLAHWPGNLGRVLEWVASNDEPRVGWGDSLRLIGQATSLSYAAAPRFEQRVFLTIDPVRTGTLPGLLFVLLVAAVWVARRKGWRAELRLCTTVAVLWAASPWFVATLVRPLEYWLVEWLRPLVAVSWLAVGLVAVRLVAVRLEATGRWGAAGSRPRTVAAVLVAGWTIATVLHTADVVAASPGRATDRELVLTLADAAVPVLDEGGPTELVLEGDSFGALAYGEAIANVVDRRGRSVCVRGDLVERFGPSRECPAGPTRQLLLRLEPEARAIEAPATLVGVYDPLSPTQRETADQFTRELTEVLLADGRADEVGLLGSPDAARLLDDASPALAARADTVQRLAELRRIEGTRAVLLSIPAG